PPCGSGSWAMQVTSFQSPWLVRPQLPIPQRLTATGSYLSLKVSAGPASPDRPTDGRSHKLVTDRKLTDHLPQGGHPVDKRISFSLDSLLRQVARYISPCGSKP